MLDSKPLPLDGINSIDISEGQSLGIQERKRSTKSLHVEMLDLELAGRVSRVYPVADESSLPLDIGKDANIFIQTSVSDKVPGYTQPDPFDRFVVFITVSDRPLNEVASPVVSDTLPVHLINPMKRRFGRIGS